MYLLSGLVRCGYVLDNGERCGSRMGGGQFGHDHTPKYRCIAAFQERRHPGGYAMMRPVEDDVVAWLRSVADEVDTAADTAAAAIARSARRGQDAKRLGREFLELDQALTRLTVDRAKGLVPEAAYAAARDELEQQKHAVDGRRRQAEIDARAGAPAAAARRLLEGWHEDSVEHRRGALRELIAEIRVAPGRPRCSVEVVPSWA